MTNAVDMHTPGPWHWDSDPIKGDELNRIRFRVCALGRTITQCYYPGEEGSQAEADAKLIAAAPELLAALRHLIDAPELEMDEPVSIYTARVLDKARTVIAKATGAA